MGIREDLNGLDDASLDELLLIRTRDFVRWLAAAKARIANDPADEEALATLFAQIDDHLDMVRYIFDELLRRVSRFLPLTIVDEMSVKLAHTEPLKKALEGRRGLLEKAESMLPVENGLREFFVAGRLADDPEVQSVVREGADLCEGNVLMLARERRQLQREILLITEELKDRAKEA